MTSAWICVGYEGKACLEEPFLHVLHGSDEWGSSIATFTCTKHVSQVRHLPILDFNGTPQVHEATEVCLDPESVWDVEENRCVVEEDEPILDPEDAYVTHGPFHG